MENIVEDMKKWANLVENAVPSERYSDASMQSLWNTMKSAARQGYDNELKTKEAQKSELRDERFRSGKEIYMRQKDDFDIDRILICYGDYSNDEKHPFAKFLMNNKIGYHTDVVDGGEWYRVITIEDLLPGYKNKDLVYPFALGEAIDAAFDELEKYGFEIYTASSEMNIQGKMDV